MQIKWRNYGLWVALASLATMAITDATGVAQGSVEPYVDTFLTILTAAGVVTNPEKGKGFNFRSEQKENEGGR